MKHGRGLITVLAAILLGWIQAVLLASPASAAASSVSCMSSFHRALAAGLDRDIGRALRGRVSTVAVGVDDRGVVNAWLFLLKLPSGS